MDDKTWYYNKLLEQPPDRLQNKIMIDYLQQLSVLELAYLHQLISSLIGGQENIRSVISRSQEEAKVT